MTVITKKAGNRSLPFDPARLERSIREVGKLDSQEFVDKAIRTITAKERFAAEEVTPLLINMALAEVDEVNAEYLKVAARFFMRREYKKAATNRTYDAADKYGDYFGLQKKLAGMGIYSQDILKKYTKEEIEEAASIIDPEKDELFEYTGAKLLTDRYTTKGFEKETYELPQERWLTIAMYLMQNYEPKKRLEYIKEAYWAMSNRYMTVATPTLANSGTANRQLSSCFIDTTEDSLEGIYNSNTDLANVSKFGGGIGVYMGKVRSRGSSIRGHKGASSGVLPWIKQLNNTSVSVDQLGVRQGAIAVYLDIWHKDIEMFLDLKLNNGDDRLRAHDIFTGVCLPDLFMEKVDQRADWCLFDPHEVKEVMGFSLEDYYDEKKGSGSFREKYELCMKNNDLSKEIVPAIDLMKRVMKSQLETGTPYMFYRDEANRANPNKHEGIVYCSNLCSEIMQNMKPSIQKSVKLENNAGEIEVVTRRTVGDFVVCNLSSINLGRAVPDGVLERLIPIQVRMLDAVIDLNKIPVPQAEHTNSRYRGIGLGTFGWHYLLAVKNIKWETQEAVDYADTLYEDIAFLTIKASSDLAAEKGSYPLFEGSDWQTGAYFEQRGYFEQENSARWVELHEKLQRDGLRNGYLMAVAPNTSTATIAGSTASIDPIFKDFYHEEKKDYKLPIVAPELNHKTYDVYRRSAYMLDQRWSVRQNAARQRHIDQAISFNIYVPNDIKASTLLNLHLQAWESGMKTTYYTRSRATDIEECEWCHS